jgi:hypothetical protein
MSNYKSMGQITAGLINSGGTSLIPAAGSDDSRLLNQQTAYAALCDGFIMAVSVIRNGRDVTNDAQKFYLAIMQNSQMTLAVAQSYFPSVSPVFWSSGVIDYKAAYSALITTPFTS